MISEVAGTLNSNKKAAGSATNQDAEEGLLIAFGGNNQSGPIDVATAQTAHGGAGRMDFESETFVAHALRAEGFDASEDGTGRRTPLVPIAFSSKDHGADAMSDLSPTLRAMGHAESHANAGGQLAVAHPYTLAVRGRGDTHNLEYRQDGTANAILTPNGGRAGIGVGAVAFAENSRAELRLCGGDGAVSSQLTTGGGKPGQGQPCIADRWAVRRLTPTECERLQGFPDGWTKVPYRGKTAADGPRYKALGNSMAVNVMRWIGRRIEMVEGLEIMKEAAE